MGTLATLVACAIGLCVLWIFCKLLSFPLRLIWKLVVSGVIGVVVLLVVNVVGGLFGLLLPITWLTAVLTGIFGVPMVVILIVIALLF